MCEVFRFLRNGASISHSCVREEKSWIGKLMNDAGMLCQRSRSQPGQCCEHLDRLEWIHKLFFAVTNYCESVFHVASPHKHRLSKYLHDCFTFSGEALHSVSHECLTCSPSLTLASMNVIYNYHPLLHDYECSPLCVSAVLCSATHHLPSLIW